VENLKGRDYLGDLGIYGKTILDWEDLGIYGKIMSDWVLWK
jgi:hypothetical protein